jgi:hypothetical protein
MSARTTAAALTTARLRLGVTGAVQGAGFRPFPLLKAVYRNVQIGAGSCG